MNNPNDINQKILNGEDINISAEQKQKAIEKEEYYRNLYHQYFDLDWSNQYKGLCKSLVDGYENLKNNFNSDNKEKDIELIIKFAFRDFYLLIFINKNEIFNNSEFLKNLHRKVYFNDNFVTIKEFNELVDYCKSEIKNDAKK